ncbi:DOPA 4,5-dioxygenase family protein [Leptolyngbya cf. ectocarpi LEGE 11479]|uniref:DOPA 4,5-dioxygenase family protein n=1 Tax=Leptolyngbya cf. ectocarpi LEGE 11479 TaxID=1828722 RepID=A0A928WZX7_LEPEC|nr:DOPA 4,5-dioxygenase family protein [Leptolyngbya ectocarpi]MBE9065375.1 DOPA 4,5-dioxygenase family protein [Leptolyngbya cf. ectocarpi LEGE 11479]
MTKRPANNYEQYHAHVYFDENSVAKAFSICQEAGKLFGVKVGRVHQKLVGPHPRWSCQLAFDKTQFDGLIPWLDNQRENLTVLVHALTGSDLEDHTEHASWLGDPIPLKLSVFGENP